MKVIDNFLPDEYFKAIQTSILSSNFSWNYSEGIVDPVDENYQFVCCLYDNEGLHPIKDKVSKSTVMLIHPILHKLNAYNLYRIKANLTLKTQEHDHTKYHTDYPDMTTAILYINTNNGWTNFKNGDKVECVSNRIVIFDSNLEHEGVTCTDQNRKVVINFNYV